MSTPAEELDEAIAKYAAAMDEGGGALSAWALSYEVSYLIQEENVSPLAKDTSYAVSAGISGAHATGLLRRAAHQIDVATDWAENEDD